eukprot:6213556-Pleurochrysis_carterae.AAC.7
MKRAFPVGRGVQCIRGTAAVPRVHCTREQHAPDERGEGDVANRVTHALRALVPERLLDSRDLEQKRRTRE